MSPRGAARALFGRRARLRWVHLVLGGALSMPYLLVAAVAIGPLFPRQPLLFGSLPLQLSCFAAALPMAAVSALFPPARPLVSGAVRALCGVPPEALADTAAGTAADRLRTALWYVLHLGVGAVVSGTMLATPPYAAVLVVLPLFPALRESRFLAPDVFDQPVVLALAPLAGGLLLLALAAWAAGAAALLARCAPALLGPALADRLAAVEARASELAARDRIARELHDAVGHALSAVTLQAAAARRVLDRDPGFAREALTAIEDTTRRTVGELDAVLALLRTEDGAPPRPARAPALAEDLAVLLAHTRSAGLPVRSAVDGDLTALPPLLAREGYRIVQEGLGNALRHATGAPVDLRLALRDGALEIVLTNPATPGTPSRPGGGHGVRGLAERARLLGGTVTAGPAHGTWTLCARLPVRGGP